MQYKIPIQIENEDVIVFGLSLRQIIIIMLWGGVGYAIFRFGEPRVGAQIALFMAAPFGIIGIVVALLRIYEMTFLPATLNYFRLILNSKERRWSQGTDSFSDMEIGYITPENAKKSIESNKTYDQVVTDELSERISKI